MELETSYLPELYLKDKAILKLSTQIPVGHMLIMSTQIPSSLILMIYGIGMCNFLFC